MADTGESGVGTQDTATEPHGEALHHVLADGHVDGGGLMLYNLLVGLQSVVDPLLDQFLHFGVEPVEEGAAARQHDVLVQLTAVIHRTRLDGVVDHLVYGRPPVGVDELGVEEHFRAEESFVAHVDLHRFSAIGGLVDQFLELVRQVVAAVLAQVFLIEFLEFLHDVAAHIPVLLLDSPGDVEGVLARHRLLPLSQHAQHELGDISTRQRDVLHTAADDKSVSDGEHVGHTISRIDNQPSERRGIDPLSTVSLVGHLRVEGKSSLHTNEEPLDSEGLEHNLRHLLSVLRSVEGRLSEDEPVLLWLAAEVGVDGLVPVFLDAFPVLYLASLEDIADLVSLLVVCGFITYVVVHVVGLKLGVFLVQRSGDC
mmetsp:Transcript_1316/g.1688  ORF Transcript_1316/g.1688 Transcript_1316/m.1688 type:complete len:369 (-) Transcript_1316:101-1207(-)